MTIGTTSKFSEFKLLLGDGATPTEAFAAPCGVVSRGITRKATVNSVMVPDCSDEDAVSYPQKSVTAIEQAMSGSGLWTRESWTIWLAWFRSGAPKNVKVQHSNVASGAVEFETGAAILTQFDETAEKGGRVQVNFALEFTGEITTVNKA